MNRSPALLLMAVLSAASASQLKPNQEILFYPAAANRSPDGKSWELQIRGSVYELDKRPVTLALFRASLELSHVHLNAEEGAIFKERARLFLVDHKAGRNVVVRIGEREFKLGRSHADGRFSGVARITEQEAELLQSGKTEIRAVLPERDRRVFSCLANFFEDGGLTVISDIDDTIKITKVGNRSATLRNTFLDPFQPVPGMPEVYRTWARDRRAQFCYVSASPWQLFLPLDTFLETNGFPSGVFYLKKFRWKDESFWNLFESPELFKPPEIIPLLEKFPRRQFVLVGDSGERDPEIYGTLARRFPKQVFRIFIRNVSGKPGKERYQKAFRDVPEEVWKVFNDPAEIAGALP